MNIAIEILQLQLTVNYLLNPDEWTRPKVNTERSQMNNSKLFRHDNMANCQDSIVFRHDNMASRHGSIVFHMITLEMHKTTYTVSS